MVWKNGTGRQAVQQPVAMRRRLTPEQREVAKLSYEEIGRSLATLVLEHGKSEQEVWDMVADLGLYEPWEFQGWLILHRKFRRHQIETFQRRQKRTEKRLELVRQARPTKLLKALSKSKSG